MTDHKANFRANLRGLRKASGLTQQELAGRFNARFGTRIDRPMVSKWENGFQMPGILTVGKVGNVLWHWHG